MSSWHRAFSNLVGTADYEKLCTFFHYRLIVVLINEMHVFYFPTFSTSEASTPSPKHLSTVTTSLNPRGLCEVYKTHIVILYICEEWDKLCTVRLMKQLFLWSFQSWYIGGYPVFCYEKVRWITSQCHSLITNTIMLWLYVNLHHYNGLQLCNSHTHVIFLVGMR